MARVACDLSDVLNAARLALVAAGVVADAQSWLTLDADDMLAGTPNPPLAGVMFDSFGERPDTLSAEDTEDASPTMEGDLVIALWVRVPQDSPGKDAAALTHATLGAVPLVSQVIATLHNHDLTNPAGDTITWRPLLLPRVQNRGRWRQDKNWRSFLIRLNCCFQWSPSPANAILDTAGSPLRDTGGGIIREP